MTLLCMWLNFQHPSLAAHVALSQAHAERARREYSPNDDENAFTPLSHPQRALLSNCAICSGPPTPANLITPPLFGPGNPVSMTLLLDVGFLYICTLLQPIPSPKLYIHIFTQKIKNVDFSRIWKAMWKQNKSRFVSFLSIFPVFFCLGNWQFLVHRTEKRFFTLLSDGRSYVSNAKLVCLLQ